MKRTLTLLLLAGTGCGPVLVHAGAQVASAGLSSGTGAVAAGGAPKSGDAMVAALGVAMMVAGTASTPPSARQHHPPTPVIPPSRHTAGPAGRP